MALTTTQLRSLLDPDEPDYKKLAALLHPDDLPLLSDLVQGEDAMLAAKAAYAITLVHDDSALQALDVAAASRFEIVRVAAAGGLKNLRGFDVQNVAEQLLADADTGVRKQAIKSAKTLGMSALAPALQALASNDSEPGIRALAADALNA
jgi:hypothetical protein